MTSPGEGIFPTEQLRPYADGRLGHEPEEIQNPDRSKNQKNRPPGPEKSANGRRVWKGPLSYLVQSYREFNSQYFGGASKQAVLELAELIRTSFGLAELENIPSRLE
jgi:hypothetical protein